MDQAHRRRGYSPSKIKNPATGEGWHNAYHFFIGKDGTLVQTRLHDERTQHTACGLGLQKCKETPAVNDHSLAIVLAGNFEHEQPTRPQLRALRKLVKELDAQYHFQKIMTHRDASPTSCPGDNLVNAIQDLLRKGEEPWNVTRYYTPVQGQTRYYRTVSDKDFIHTALKHGLVEQRGNEYWHGYATEPVPIGHSLSEADAWFKDRAEYREAIRQELEYLADFKVNCSGDCLVPADGSRYTAADAGKVVACPGDDPNTPEAEGFPLGTKFHIEGIGNVTCRDRGGAIVGKRLDLWMGQGTPALDLIRSTKGGPMKVTVLP